MGLAVVADLVEEDSVVAVEDLVEEEDSDPADLFPTNRQSGLPGLMWNLINAAPTEEIPAGQFHFPALDFPSS